MTAQQSTQEEVQDSLWLGGLQRLRLLELGNLWWVDEDVWRLVIGHGYDSDRKHHPALCTSQGVDLNDMSSPFSCLYGSRSRRMDGFPVRNITPPVPPNVENVTRFGAVGGILFHELWVWMTRTPKLVYRIPGARTSLDAAEKAELKKWLDTRFQEGRP